MTKFSYSRVDCFKRCPYLYKLRYLDGLRTLPTDDPSSPLILGSTIHLAIEKGLDEAREYYFNQYPIIDDNHITEFMKIECLVPKVMELLPKGENEVKIEDEEFVGYIDYLTEDSIFDYKYSNNVDNYLQSGQLHVYKHFFEKTNSGKTIKNINYIFLPKIQIRQKKTESLYDFRKRLLSELEQVEVRIIKVDFDPAKVGEYLDGVEEAKTATEFPKNETRLCSWCEFEPYCKRKEDTMLLPENKRRDINKISKKVVWLYGSPFSGKTYLANKFPDPLMLNTDGNIKFVDAPYIFIKDDVVVDGRITKRKPAWEKFKEVIDELEKKQNDFKTIVVDLLEDTYEHCRAYKYAELGVEHESDAGFGKGYDMIRKEFLDNIKRLTNLDYENIILISHEDSSKNITKRGGETTTTIRPNIQEKLASKIAGMVDIVARVVADGDSRVLSFKNNEYIFGGGRLNVKGQDIPLSYDELMNVYDEANKSTATKTEVKTNEQPATERRRVEVTNQR